MILHHLRSYARRFRAEWAAFVLTSCAASLLTLLCPVAVPNLPLVALEWTALAWFTLRVMQAEPAFVTHGGWRARPVAAGQLRTARWLLYFSALLPAFLCRAWCLHRAVDLSDGLWWSVLWREWLPWLAILTAAAALVSVAGTRVANTAGRRWTMLGTGLVAAAVVIAIGAALTGARGSRSMSSSGGSDRTPRGICPHLPPGERILTLSDRAGGRETVDRPLRLLLRLPLRAGSSASIPGMHAAITACQPTGLRLAFAMEITGLSRTLRLLGDSPVLAVRYAGGIWAPQMRTEHRREGNLLAGMNTTRQVEGGDFMSPVMEPWNTRTWPELLAGAELIIFVPDPHGPLPPEENLPPRAWSIGAAETTLTLPELPPQPTAEQLHAAAQAAVDQFHTGAGDEQQVRGLQLLEKAGPAIVPQVLECGPFGEGAWQLLEPFLSKHATADHLPAMLRLLEKDGRIGSVMVRKGWKEQALPLLRQHLLNGLPLTTDGLVALAEIKDAALAPALRLRLLREFREQDALADALRDHPGLDWPTLARDCWYRRAFHGPIARMWTEQCAQTGDRTIFRAMAGDWLRSTKPPDSPTIRSWIAESAWHGEPRDFPAWLRANCDRLAWDATLKRWSLAPGK